MRCGFLTEGINRVTLKYRFIKVLKKDWQYYLLCLPAIIYVAIFNYGPMYGIQLAFKDFVASKGIIGSPWTNPYYRHFQRFFNSPIFWDLIRNTLRINIYGLLAGTPVVILLSLLINQTRNLKFKKITQTTLYAPHFISMVVMCGMVILFLSPSTGIVNHVLDALGFEKIFFLSNASMFIHIYIWSGIWQSAGWGTIIYVAALSNVNIELYDSAKIDGASKLQLIKYIDIPTIIPTFVILLVLNLGSMMSLGFQKAFLLQNAYNLKVSEVISTYVYKIALLAVTPQFGLSTAISLFNTVINVILLVTANKIVKSLNETSLF